MGATVVVGLNILLIPFWIVALPWIAAVAIIALIVRALIKE